MKIIVTIPAFNEEETIGYLIEDIERVMRKNQYEFEVIVVDDGSTDGTPKIAKDAGAIVHSHLHNQGLAQVFKTEIERALERNADVIVHIDADYQYNPKEIPKLLEPIFRTEADLVLGSRFSGTIEEMSYIKRIGNLMFSKITSFIVRQRITDAQTGFRAFTRRFAKQIEISSAYTYTQEMIIRAVKQKFGIKEVPINFARRSSGDSRLISNTLEYAIKASIDILKACRD